MLFPTTHKSFIYLLFLGTLCLTSCKTSRSARGNTSTATRTHTKKKTKSTTSNKAVTRLSSRILQDAQKLKGSPYKYAGRSPKGFDCSGFTHYVLGQHNIILPTSSSGQSKIGKEIPLKQVKAGDLVFFGRYGRKGKIMHVALVVDNTPQGILVIHSTSSRGVREDNITTSSYWKPKILFARRVL